MVAKRTKKMSKQVGRRNPQSDQIISQEYNLVWVGEAVTFTATSLTLRDNLSYDEWAEVGLKIARVKRFTTWAIADWLNYGERKYAEHFSQAADETGLQPSYLATIKWVGAAIEPSRRRERLSFTHHRVVAKLPPTEQDRFLDLAEKNGWSRDELEIQVKQHSSKPVEKSQMAAEQPEQDEAPPPDNKPETTFLTVDEVENCDEQARGQARESTDDFAQNNNGESIDWNKALDPEGDLMALASQCEENIKRFLNTFSACRLPRSGEIGETIRLLEAAQYDLGMFKGYVARLAQPKIET